MHTSRYRLFCSRCWSIHSFRFKSDCKSPKIKGCKGEKVQMSKALPKESPPQIPLYLGKFKEDFDVEKGALGILYLTLCLTLWFKQQRCKKGKNYSCRDPGTSYFKNSGNYSNKSIRL